MISEAIYVMRRPYIHQKYAEKSMNTLEIMNKSNIQINISTLCMSLKLKYISYENFENYGLVDLLNEPDMHQVIACNVFECDDKEELFGSCTKILETLSNDQKSYEASKWLFASLKYARNSITNPQELLQKISEIYADFGYPPSMQNIIYYLPPSNDYDPTKYTLEENRARLVRLFDEYLVMLQKSILSHKYLIMALDFL